MTANAQKDDVQTLKSEFEDLRADVAALNENLQRLLQRQEAASAAGAGESETATEESPDELEALRRKVEDLRNSGEEAAEELAREVEQHPLLSVGIAFGAGYLLARITGAIK